MLFPRTCTSNLVVLQICLRVCQIFKGSRDLGHAPLEKIFTTLLIFAKIERFAKYQMSVLVCCCVIHHYSVQPFLKAKVGAVSCDL